MGTSIDIGNITIMEPVTALTDIMVALVCFYAFWKLASSKNAGYLFNKLYRYFFLLMSFATLYGGLIGHAFINYLSFEWKIPGWIVSMLSVALAERAAIMHARPLLKKNIGNFFSVINILEVTTFIFLVLFKPVFLFVEIHALYGLLLILFSFELFVYKKTGDKGSKLTLWSVFFSLLAMVCHLTKFSIHKWFNYLDISHVFMAISAYILFRGVIVMKVALARIKETT